MPEFTISKERVTAAMNIIIQFLKDSGYEGSLEDGTGLNDIVIKPSSVIYELMAQLADRAGAYQSLQRAMELRGKISEEEYDNAVDCVLSNWFITRNDGKPSRGLVRLWFLKPLDFVHITDEQILGTIDSYNLQADGDQVFTESDFSCVINTAENQDEYYIDVVARTQDLTNFAPDTSSELNASYDDIYFLRGEVPSTFTAGSGLETSDAFIRRTEKAITTRELITDRAIHTVLRDTFDDIIRLYVARHGSGEQLRDIVTFEGVTVHVGNKADIYIASDLTKVTLDINVLADGTIDVEQLPASSVVCGFVSCEQIMDDDPEFSKPLELEFEIDEKSFGSFTTPIQGLKVKGYAPVESPEGEQEEEEEELPYADFKARITLLADPILRSIHEFVYSETQRVACYDPMVKHMFPCILRPIINIQLIDKTEDSRLAIEKSVVEYVHDIVRDGQPWVESELVTKIHNDVPNVKKILLPMRTTGSLLDPLTSKIKTFPVGNMFTVNNDMPRDRSIQVTDNTVQFYTDKDLITIKTDYAGE